MMAVGHLMKDARPDLILSGVNRGANLGEDVTYSGTVSAADGRRDRGRRDPSRSARSMRARAWATPSRSPRRRGWGERVARALLAQPDRGKTLINVNFPALPADQVKGIKVARQGFHDVERNRIVHRRRSARLPLFLVRPRP